MRNLKYAILGLLDRKSMTGYDISKEFGRALAEFWSADHSQIYPELRRLVNEGLVEYQVVISGEVMEKKLYSLTKEGKADFLHWLCRDEEIEPTPKDRFRLRMYFANEIDGERLIALLNSQLDQRKQKREHLAEALEACEGRRHGEPGFGDRILIEGALRREDAYIHWLEECIAEEGI